MRTSQLSLRTVPLSFRTRQRTPHDSDFQNENQENVQKTLNGCSLLHFPPGEPLLRHIEEREVPASKRLMCLCQLPLGSLHLNKGNFTPEEANSVDRNTNTVPLHSCVTTVKKANSVSLWIRMQSSFILRCEHSQNKLFKLQTTKHCPIQDRLSEKASRESNSTSL